MSIGLGLRMMQGGVDRTGFAKMADELGNPGLDLIAARRAAASQAAAMDEFEKRMEELFGDKGESDELPIVPTNRDELMFGPMFENLEGKTVEQVKADPNLELPVGGYDQIVRDYEMSIGEKMFGDDPISFMPGVKQSTATDLGIDALRYGIAPVPSVFYDVFRPTVMGDGTLYGNEFEFMPQELLDSMADGGRVGMQLGGGIMNNLLGNPQVQSMLQQYQQPTMDFSQVASPSIPQPAVAPATPPQAYTPFVSTMPLYDPSTLGTGLPSTAGMADPFFVYDPYSPVGAFDAPPPSTGPTPLTQDKIMETFKNLDKFTLAKQKEKAEAAEKTKKQTRRGGGGSQEDRARNEARRAAMTERARDARNRGRGFSGRGTSDPGGQAARGA